MPLYLWGTVNYLYPDARLKQNKLQYVHMRTGMTSLAADSWAIKIDVKLQSVWWYENSMTNRWYDYSVVFTSKFLL